MITERNINLHRNTYHCSKNNKRETIFLNGAHKKQKLDTSIDESGINITNSNFTHMNSTDELISETMNNNIENVDNIIDSSIDINSIEVFDADIFSIPKYTDYADDNINNTVETAMVINDDNVEKLLSVNAKSNGAHVGNSVIKLLTNMEKMVSYYMFLLFQTPIVSNWN